MFDASKHCLYKDFLQMASLSNRFHCAEFDDRTVVKVSRVVRVSRSEEPSEIGSPVQDLLDLFRPSDLQFYQN